MNETTPAAYIPIDRRLALAQNLPLPDRTAGAALFADISGFTPLTEALAAELGPQRGPEELTHQINRVYSALIALVHRFRGSVISFSGDAITCWFDTDSGRRATTCALAMQQAMTEFAEITTPTGSIISLSIKVAAVAGPVCRFLVGHPDICLIDALAGDTLDHLAAAEKQAGKGEVVIGQGIVERLGDTVAVSEWRQAKGQGGDQWRFAVVTGLSAPAEATPWPEEIPLPPEVVRPWLLPAVHKRLQSGQGEFLAELRPAAALFLKFAGIAYDQDPEAGPKLDIFIRWVQGVLTCYEGSLLQLNIGDKGSYLYASFGAPIAHDDAAGCAVAAALVLQSLPPEMAFIDPPQIGLAFGRMRTGASGSPSHRTYGVLGDKVNLAARLMGVAGPGEIRCEYDLYRRARGQWAFQALPPVRVKGKASPIRLYAPTGEPAGRRLAASEEQTAFVGRRRELRRLSSTLDAAEDGDSCVLLITGEAGIGKSRLTAELTRLARERGHPWLEGAGSSIEQHTPYRVWRDVFSFYFGLDDILEPAQRRARLQDVVSGIAPDLIERLPLINDVLGTDLPDTASAADLDPAQRRQNLFALVLDLAQAWVQERPLILILDDVQWLDSPSWQLALHVAQELTTAKAPFLIVLVSRPPVPLSPTAKHIDDLCRSLDVETISLNVMRPDETAVLAAAALGLSPQALPDSVADLVRQKAGGNPFFAEEFALALRDQGLIAIQPADSSAGPRCTVLQDLDQATRFLPDTIQGLILARIDRLPPDNQLTLKVAAVIGRSFAYPLLLHALQQHTATTTVSLDAHLYLLSALDMILLDAPDPVRSYLFKHIITQEVAYQTLLFAQRRAVHRSVAEVLERLFPERKEELLGLLAYHWEQAEDAEKAVEYLLRAGDRARQAYAHQEAIDYYKRALALLKKQDEYEGAARTLMKLGLTYHNAFDFARAREAYDEGFALWQQAGVERGDPPPPAPRALKILSIEPSTLDSAMATGVCSSEAIEELYSGLVEYGSGWTVLPNVAQSWEVSADGCRYVFHLRDNIYWSDGTPVTAGDYEYAWKRVLDPATGSPLAHHLYIIEGGQDFHQGKLTHPGLIGVQAVDDVTLQVDLEEPVSYFLHLLTYCTTFPVPRHVVEAHGKNWTEMDKLVTNGPFRLESWQRGKSMVFLRDPAYHGRFRGNVQRVEQLFTGERSASEICELYEADKVDSIWLSPDLDWVRSRYAGEYLSGPYLSTLCVGFDASRAPFDDVRVRRAFTLATDRETLADIVMSGYHFPATGGFIPLGMAGHSPGIALPYDPERARHLLAEAGYLGGRGFPVVELLMAIWEKDRCEYLQTQWWENLGVEITWEALESGLFSERIDNHLPHVFSSNWRANYPDPDYFLRVAMGFIQDRARWRNNDYNRLVEEARRVMDQEERLKLYRQADRLLVEEAVILPLAYSRWHRLLKPWVKAAAGVESDWRDVVIKEGESSRRCRIDWRDVIIEPH